VHWRRGMMKAQDNLMAVEPSMLVRKLTWPGVAAGVKRFVFCTIGVTTGKSDFIASFTIIDNAKPHSIRFKTHDVELDWRFLRPRKPMEIVIVCPPISFMQV
jgi:hypothetical protein